MRILLLYIGIIFATELEVDGNLKVTGNIDAQNNSIKNVGVPTDMNDAVNAQFLQNTLSEDGPFDIEYYQVWFHYGASTGGTLNIKYRGDGETEFTDDWTTFINQKSLEGWSHTAMVLTSGADMMIYELRRPIEE